MSQHSEWLQLVEYSGPFLAEPVLDEAFPQGLAALSPDKRRLVRQGYEEWREAQLGEDPDLDALHSEWTRLVLARVLEYDVDGSEEDLLFGDAIAPALVLKLPEYDLEYRPSFALVHWETKASLLLGHKYPPGTDLEAPLPDVGWAASPADRMADLCRATDCRLGLVTNGEHWLFVDAPRGGTTTLASWYAGIWLQEPVTLQAFVNLLNFGRFHGESNRTLGALLDRSLEHQDVITDTLGEQVFRAIEVLIQSLDRVDEDRNRTLLKNVGARTLYEAALTIMMRLVFILSAEERDLLLMGDERFESFYALSTMRAQLRETPDEVLEHRYDAWARLIALFRVIYGGIEHENLRLPALGGTLFDPDRYPFLEGRAEGSDWRESMAVPLPIDNRTILLLLEAIQLYRGRTLSYRGLDIEQLGHVYEGLLDHTVSRLSATTLELAATQQSEIPSVTLDELESSSDVEELLVERTGSALQTVRNRLRAEPTESDRDRLLVACRNDGELCGRILPFIKFVRVDPWGHPLVFPAGAFCVTTGLERRQTGSHYTPKALTSAIVSETLEPLVYVGPSEGRERAAWQLRSAAELLDLKVCDPAMGSGAFLVQVCRWLAERVVEAWQGEESRGRFVDRDGAVVASLGQREPMTRDPELRLIVARRMVAERCIYGVDMNPLAVELAKLSIWLITLAKGRPFGFLDHNLRSGDSLLGIRDLDQLYHFHMDPVRGEALHQGLFDPRPLVERGVNDALELRQRLRKIPVLEFADVKRMRAMDLDARRFLEIPISLADALVGAAYRSGDDGAGYDASVTAVAEERARYVSDTLEGKSESTMDSIDAVTVLGEGRTNPFHWAVQFPEVFGRENAGFDAIVGNPPFMGGKRISGALGSRYREYLVTWIAASKRGSADLVAYFFRRAYRLLRDGGNFGLLAVNTIAEGDTREVGLEKLCSEDATIYRAYPNEPWPGAAAVVTSRVHIHKGPWLGESRLSGRMVKRISSYLSDEPEGTPERLPSNKRLAYQGSIVLGMGFTLEPEEARRLIESDPRNADVLFPYLNGKELNTDPQQQASRWVINFWDWPEKKAREYEDCFRIVEQKVKPERQEKKPDGSYKKRKPLPQKWWIYADKRPALYHAIGRGHSFEKHPREWSPDTKPVEHVLVKGRVSKHHAIAIVENVSIFAERLVVFTKFGFESFAILQSSIHEIWALRYGSTLETRPLYTPSDVLETFPLPRGGQRPMRSVGHRYHDCRCQIMTVSGFGLNECHNRFHDSTNNDDKIVELRELLCEMDYTICAAYGWDGIDLEHDFYVQDHLPENDNVRFTLSNEAKSAVLQKLFELNKAQFESESIASSDNRQTPGDLVKKKQPAKRDKSENQSSQIVFFDD